MKVLLFLPFPPESPTGNAITARRIAKNLASRELQLIDQGAEVSMCYLSAEATLEEVQAAIEREHPAVLMWYHAWKTARWLPQLRLARPLPSVITLTGTDINRDAIEPHTREAVLDALRKAEAVVTYSAALREHAVALLPDISPRVHVIPKGVDLPSDEFEPPAWMQGDTLLFFLPAGIRPEKNNRFAVRALDAVHAEDPRVRLLLAGPILHREYADALREDLASRPWAGHIESIPHSQMGSVYARSAVVLNTSLSEGLANSVIEAMTCGRPMLASDIEGNRQVIEPDVTGLLYRDEADFVAKARRLVTDPALRERLGIAAPFRAQERFSSNAEATAIAQICEEAGLGRSSHPELERILAPIMTKAMWEIERSMVRRGAENEPLQPCVPEDQESRQSPNFGRIGRIAESSSRRVRADHATDAVGQSLVSEGFFVTGKTAWEVGCGTGVLSALCAKLGAREVWATDLDDQALPLAAETARLNGVKVRVAKASLMELDEDIRPDIVIANLPQKPVPPGIKLPVANDGGPDGTGLLLPFLEQAERRMRPGSRLYLFKHSLSSDNKVFERIRSGFFLRSSAPTIRYFDEAEFADLLPHWRDLRSKGLCEFVDVGPGRYAFFCAALVCVRR